MGFWEVMDWWIVCWWSHLRRGPSAKQNYFVSTFYSCSIPGPLILDSWILGSVHITPFSLQRPPLAAPQSWDNHCDTNSFETKMHLHTPGVVTLLMQARLMFSSRYCLTSEWFLLSLHGCAVGQCRETRRLPDPALALLPHRCRQEKGIYFTAAAPLQKSC